MTRDEAMKWCRLYAEFALDPKVQVMSEALQRRLVMLFCLQTAEMLRDIDDDELAAALKITPAELAKTKALFLRKGFIRENWQLTNWEKRQFKSDTSTDRVRKHRSKSGPETSGNVSRNGGETFPKRSCNGLEQNRTETEQSRADTTPTPSGSGGGVELSDKGSLPYPTEDDLLHIHPGPHEHDPADAERLFQDIWRAFGSTDICHGWYESQRRFSIAAWRSAFSQARRQNRAFGSIGYVEKIAHKFNPDGSPRGGQPMADPTPGDPFTPDPNADLNRDREAIMSRKWGSPDA